MKQRALVKDWQTIDTAPEARIIQVIAAGDKTPSLAIRRGNRWVWFPGEVLAGLFSRIGWTSGARGIGAL